MATHSSVLAWRIPGSGEPGGLPSMGSHRVGNDCSTLAAAAGKYWIKEGGRCHIKDARYFSFGQKKVLRIRVELLDLYCRMITYMKYRFEEVKM